MTVGGAPLREVILLLLGATGSGKSTLINAIANYIRYSSLEEALKGEPINVIPLQFEIYDENYKPKILRMGTQDGNERLEVGISSTQTYRFWFPDNIYLRCIVTPSIGDTRGRDRDRVNFKATMEQLSYPDTINGICILIDPNSPRLTDYFKFCLDDLLMHKGVCKNIMFVFSKSRGNNFEPGDSLATLTTVVANKKCRGIQLDKNSIYCVDNECVRLLAKHFNGIELNAMERANSDISWQHSSEEIFRLVNHVSPLKPHSTIDIASPNKVEIITLGQKLDKLMYAD